MKRHITVVILAAAVVLAGVFVESVCGYHYYKCSNNGKKVVWPDKKLNWRAGKNSFPSGSSWRTAEAGHGLLVPSLGSASQHPGSPTSLNLELCLWLFSEV